MEKVVIGQQADQADIKVGDYLIAINTINTTDAPAKISLRILGITISLACLPDYINLSESL